MVVGGAAISGFISYVLWDLAWALFVGGVGLVAGAIGLVLGVRLARLEERMAWRWFFVIGAVCVAIGVAGGIVILASGDFVIGGVILGLVVYAAFSFCRLWRRFGRHFANPS